MKLDNEKLHRHIIRKLKLSSMSQRQLALEIDVSRSTMYRLLKNRPLTLVAFLRLVEWLDEEVNTYVIKRRYYENESPEPQTGQSQPNQP
jgi:transcriptional regulator with XRE-family HTH domain